MIVKNNNIIADAQESCTSFSTKAKQNKNQSHVVCMIGRGI